MTSVEFAIVAPVLFLIVLGMFEFGRALMVLHLLSDSARLACRSGALQGKSTASIASEAQALLRSESVNANVAVSVIINGAAADSSSARAGDEITVSISVPVGEITYLPSSSYLSGNLSSKYTLFKE